MTFLFNLGHWPKVVNLSIFFCMKIGEFASKHKISAIIVAGICAHLKIDEHTDLPEKKFIAGYTQFTEKRLESPKEVVVEPRHTVTQPESQPTESIEESTVKARHAVPQPISQQSQQPKEKK
jgi:hypothetical protein